MKTFKICAYLQDDRWIAHDDAMMIETEGDGHTPLAAVMALLRKLGEGRFVMDQLELLDEHEENDDMLVFTVPLAIRRRIPQPSLN